MLKKEITYYDFDENKRTETHYFGLSKSELTETHLTTAGGLDTFIKRVAEEQDGKKIVGFFKELVLKSYGIKSDDGKRFEKSPEISKAFSETNAYDELFMELATNADAASEFIIGICPKDMQDEIRKQNAAALSK